jgi:integrase
MEIVGHSSLEMSMNVYGHVTLDDKRAAHGRFGDLLTEEPNDLGINSGVLV